MMDAKECYSSLIRQMYRANATGKGIILTSQLAERIVNHLLSIDALIAERDQLQAEVAKLKNKTTGAS